MAESQSSWPVIARASVAAMLGALVSLFAHAQGLVSSDLSGLRFVGAAQLAPDGHRVAYTVVMQDRPGRPYPLLFVMDLGTQKSKPVGDGKAPAGNPHWSPDGKWLAFQSSQGEKRGLFIAHSDGSDMTF